MIIENLIPKISVVIPTYNRENTINNCLESVLRQTVSPFEIIIVDDCSKDHTVEIVQSYTDSRIRCIVLDNNRGAQFARNKGIQEAKGEWIAFLDSDDEWIISKLEVQVKALSTVNNDPWTVIHTNANWLDVVNKKTLDIQVPLVNGDNVYGLLLSTPGPMFPGMLVSQLALEKIGYLDNAVPSYQEWDTSIRLAKVCRFIHLEEPLFIYNLHAGETISKNKKRDIEGYQFILDKFENEIKKECGVEIWNNHLLRQLTKCLEWELWNDADIYFGKLNIRGLKIRILQIIRYLHIKPSSINKIRKFKFFQRT